MEKQLLEKMRRHELDDIDKDMITARLKVAQSELEDILTELNTSLHKLQDLCDDRNAEMYLLDFGFILAFDDKIIHNDDSEHDGVPCLCTFGTRAKIEGLLKTIQKTIDS